MSAAPAQATTIVKIQERRRSQRHPVAFPVDVTLLRSGVPDRIPGRLLNLGECGLAMIAAAELSDGDSVGLEFRLATSVSPLLMKARVRHHALVSYGLEFLGVSDEQRMRIRYSFEPKPTPVNSSLLALAEIPDIDGGSPGANPKISILPGRSSWKRWLWIVIACLLLSAGLGWWRWHLAWSELESSLSASRISAASLGSLRISEDTAERLLIYRVEPFYPLEARQENVGGTVALDVAIAADGAVRNVRATAGPEPLTLAAIDAVKLWHFQPYRVNGRAVAVETTLHIDFTP